MYFGTMVLTGFVVFVGIKYAVAGEISELAVYPLIVTSCINIHHFYIDGCIWKISNPEVRKDLFAHL